MPNRSVSSRSSLVLLVVVVLAFVVACDAGQGDPCQEPDDCASGLLCCKSDPALTARGTCEETCAPLVSRDAGADASEGGVDAASDGGVDAPLDGIVADGALDAASDGGSDAASGDAASGDGATD